MRKQFVSSAILLLAGFLPWGGCSTGAVAVEECREIQYQRCEAALLCPRGDIQSADDVESCKRFYRDQCLHGIQNSEAPSADQHDACMGVLDAAMTCATNDVLHYIDENGWIEEKPDDIDYTLAKDCDGVDTTLAPGVGSVDPDEVTVCDVLNLPYAFYDCSYVSKPVEDTDSMAGSGGN